MPFVSFLPPPRRAEQPFKPSVRSIALVFLLLLAAPLAAPLSLPREGKVSMPRGVQERPSQQQEHELWYKLVRPMTLSSKQALPLVVLHGGPGVPSDYLFPLDKLDYRSVLFYDQLGCGRSDKPPFDDATYSVEASLADLNGIIRKVGITGRYHLLGQSWGGMLAFEHVLDLESKVSLEGAIFAGFVVSLLALHVLLLIPPPLSLIAASGGRGARGGVARAGQHPRMRGDG